MHDFEAAPCIALSFAYIIATFVDDTGLDTFVDVASQELVSPPQDNDSIDPPTPIADSDSSDAPATLDSASETGAFSALYEQFCGSDGDELNPQPQPSPMSAPEPINPPSPQPAPSEESVALIRSSLVSLLIVVMAYAVQ